MFKEPWRIFLFGALNLDWGSGRDLCSWSESVFIQPILTELLGSRHHVRHPQWSTIQSSGSSQWEEWGGRRRHGDRCLSGMKQIPEEGHRGRRGQSCQKAPHGPGWNLTLSWAGSEYTSEADSLGPASGNLIRNENHVDKSRHPAGRTHQQINESIPFA